MTVFVFGVHNINTVKFYGCDAMGSSVRRAKAKENLRRAILDAARELFATRDFQAVSIRKIADKIDYSPTAIYLHFKDKQEILLELIEEGFQLLVDMLNTAQHIADPLERLRAGGHIYYQFARQHPHYYGIMFQMQDIQICEELIPRCENPPRAFEFVVNAIVEGVEQGKITNTSPVPAIAHTVLAVCHGAASMYLSGHLSKLPEELHDAFFEFSIEMTIRGISSR